jgi:hypothetical protein
MNLNSGILPESSHSSSVTVTMKDMIEHFRNPGENGTERPKNAKVYVGGLRLHPIVIL